MINHEKLKQEREDWNREEKKTNRTAFVVLLGLVFFVGLIYLMVKYPPLTESKSDSGGHYPIVTYPYFFQ